MPDETRNVPQWFSDFAVKNADEHGQLATKIEASNGQLSAKIEESNARMEASYGRLATEIARAETRTTRWFIAALAVAVSVLATIIILVN